MGAVGVEERTGNGALQLRGWAVLTTACVVVGHLFYASSFGLHLAGDDINEIGKGAAGPVSGEWFVGGHGTVFLRPAFYAALWLNHAIGGTDPSGYHLVNVWIHILNAVLVALLTSEVLDGGPARSIKGRPYRALVPAIAGTTFLILPSHGEAIYWISGRADLLATAFGLVSAIAHVRSTRATGRRSTAATAVSVLALAGALASKESAVALPFAMVVLALLSTAPAHSASSGSQVRWALRAVAPHLSLLAVYFAWRWWVLGTPIGGYGVASQVSGGPLRLVAQLPVSVARTLVPSSPRIVWILLAVAGLGVGAAVLGTHCGRQGLRSALGGRRAAVGVMLLVVLAILAVPALGVGVSPFGPAGERTVYLPSVVTALLVAVLVVRIVGRPRQLVVALLVLWVVAAAVGAREANRWADADAAATAVARALSARGLGAEAYVVNLPDSVRGAVAARNSAAWLDVLANGAPAGRIQVVSAVSLVDADEEFAVSLVSTASDWTLVVRTERGRVELTGYVDDGPWQIHDRRPTSYSVTFPSEIDPDEVWIYSGGVVHPIGDLE